MRLIRTQQISRPEGSRFHKIRSPTPMCRSCAGRGGEGLARCCSHHGRAGTTQVSPALWNALALADCAQAGVELEKALGGREHTVAAICILHQSRPSERGRKGGRRSEPKHPGIVQRPCVKEQPTPASVRDKLEPVHVHKAEIGNLEMRDHRQGQKGNLQKGFGQRSPKGFRGGAQRT
jgi:hypothetical protein